MGGQTSGSAKARKESFGMRGKFLLLGLLTCVLAGTIITRAQVALAGLIDVPKDLPKTFPDIDNKTFSYQPAQEIRTVRERVQRGEGGKGFQMAARVSSNSAISVWTDDVSGYPMMAIIKGKDGDTILVPGVLTFKVNLKSGGITHTDGFDIESTKEIKAGESIPALYGNGEAILSTEGRETEPKGNPQPSPAIQIFSSAAKNRAGEIAAWRVVKGGR